MSVVVDKGCAFLVLDGISRETYVALSDDLAERHWPRLRYEQGQLEIMWNPKTVGGDLVLTLQGISWRTYSALVGDLADERVPRLTFDAGVLEMMSPSNRHERLAEIVGDFVKSWARFNGIPYVSQASTTVRRTAIKKGFEADASFLFGDRAKQSLGASPDSTAVETPDLAIEIEHARSSLSKLATYSAIGVSEVWRCDGQGLFVHVLEEDGYRTVSESQQLPGFPIHQMPKWLARSSQVDNSQLLSEFEAAIGS